MTEIFFTSLWLIPSPYNASVNKWICKNMIEFKDHRIESHKKHYFFNFLVKSEKLRTTSTDQISNVKRWQKSEKPTLIYWKREKIVRKKRRQKIKKQMKKLKRRPKKKLRKKRTEKGKDMQISNIIVRVFSSQGAHDPGWVKNLSSTLVELKIDKKREFKRAESF